MTDNFQARSVEIGKTYESHVASYIESMGFTIVGLNVEHPSGVQFDIHAKDNLGFEVGVECKAGSHESKWPGMRRTDNVWKVGGYLFQMAHWGRKNPDAVMPRYVVATTDMPESGTKWARMLQEWQLYGHVEFMQIPYPTERAA